MYYWQIYKYNHYYIFKLYSYLLFTNFVNIEKKKKIYSKYQKNKKIINIFSKCLLGKKQFSLGLFDLKKLAWRHAESTLGKGI